MERSAFELLQIAVVLVLCAVALCWAARRFNFPYPIALVIGGAILGFVPLVPRLPFDPEFILVLVLPPILYQAALLTSWRDFTPLTPLATATALPISARDLTKPLS